MILKELRRTEVFLNEGGAVTIRQTFDRHDEIMVILDADQVQAVGLELCRLAKEHQFSIYEDEEE